MNLSVIDILTIILSGVAVNSLIFAYIEWDIKKNGVL